MAKDENTKSGGRIIRCSCTHAYQDRRYGKGRRVGNIGQKGVKCTVCGKLH